MEARNHILWICWKGNPTGQWPLALVQEVTDSLKQSLDLQQLLISLYTVAEFKLTGAYHPVYKTPEYFISNSWEPVRAKSNVTTRGIEGTVFKKLVTLLCCPRVGVQWWS